MSKWIWAVFLVTHAFHYLSTLSRIGNLSSEKKDESFVGPQNMVGDISFKLLPLGNISSLIVNIGANQNPIMPRTCDGPCAMSIAFEPIVPELIKPHRQLRVIPAAVTGDDKGGIASMMIYNERGMSSSLSQASQKPWGETQNANATEKFVPTIAMRTVLQSIPVSKAIDLLMTDMQGHDFVAVSSASDLLTARVKRLRTEVYYDDFVSYDNVHNDFCRDWLPFMTKLGYTYEGPPKVKKSQQIQFNATNAETVCAHLNEKNGQRRQYKVGIREMDALWRLSTLDPHLPLGGNQSLGFYRYPTHNTHLNWTDEIYAQC